MDYLNDPNKKSVLPVLGTTKNSPFDLQEFCMTLKTWSGLAYHYQMLNLQHKE